MPTIENYAIENLDRIQIGSPMSEMSFHDQTEAAVHSACKFFGMDDLPIKEGDATCVSLNNINEIGDESLIYNKAQFEKMGWDSFEDISKVWTHELGHVISQKEFAGKGWTSELCADFMVGVRSAMRGYKFGNFESAIGATPASASHPNGELRLEAMKAGRDYAIRMMKNRSNITWNSCIDEFKKTNFVECAPNGDLQDNHNVTFCGVTDIAWLEKMVRQSSGSEQKHWLEELKWAINHGGK